MLGGARVPRGHVHGKTDPKGTSVVDGQVDAANLFHTYLQAVGVDSTDSHPRRRPGDADRRPGVGPGQGTADVSDAIDVKKTHVTKTLAHDAPLIAGRFDPAGRFVFATSQDRSVVRWRLDNERESVVRRPRQLGVRPRLLRRRADAALRRRRRPAHLVGRRRRQAGRPTDGRRPRRLGPLPRRQPRRPTVATGGNDNLVKLWTAADGKPVHTLTRPRQPRLQRRLPPRRRT